MTFTLTRAQLEAKRAELAAKGIILVGDHGSIPAPRGLTIEYEYIEPVLTVNAQGGSDFSIWAARHALTNFLTT